MAKAMTELIEQEIIKQKRRTEWWRDCIKPALILTAICTFVCAPIFHFVFKETWKESALFLTGASMAYIPVFMLVNGLSAHQQASTLGLILGMRKLYEYEACEAIRKYLGQ